MANKTLCYIPMLEGQSDKVQAWLDSIPERFGITPVMLPPVDWNDDLTPWPSGPIFKKGKAFGGNAGAYLSKLESEIIPGIEADMGIVPDERWLIGVSLSGLFAIYASAKTNLFARVASISGSFWYPGFVDWAAAQTFYAKAGYISLGDREAQSKNIHLKSIAADTQSMVKILESKGLRTAFEWTEGSHFGPIVPRLEKAIANLISI